MASVNKVIIVGNLGRDPEVRTFPSGDLVATVRIATTDRWSDKSTGASKEATEWHIVVFNGRLADIASQYLRSGSPVYVEGSLRTRKWQDASSGEDRFITEVRGDVLQMLGRSGNSEAGNPAKQSSQNSQDQPRQNQMANPPQKPRQQARPPQRHQNRTSGQPNDYERAKSGSYSGSNSSGSSIGRSDPNNLPF